MEEKIELESYIQTAIESYLYNKSLGIVCEKQKMELVDRLYRYQTMCYKNYNEISVFAIVFMQSFNACVKAYDPSKQLFLNYFNFVFARTLKKEIAKEKEELYRGGIKIDSQTQDLIRILIKYAKSKNADIYDISFQEQAAKFLDKTIQEVQHLIEINDSATTSNSNVSNEEGDTINVLEIQASDDLSPEDYVEQNASILDYLNMFDKAFNSMQDREKTKAIISILLTSKILDSIGLEKIVLEEISKKSFCNKQVLSIYIKTGKVVSVRQLAKSTGLHEASISRTFSNFIKKCEKVLNN